MRGEISVTFRLKTMYLTFPDAERAMRKVEQSFEEGAHEFLSVIQDRVPVWSGMSLAAFLGLAGAVKYHLFVRTKLFRESTKNGKKYRKKVESRVALGRKAGNFFLGVGEKPLIWVFDFKTTVPHHNINDQIDARVFGLRLKHLPIPWKSLSTALKAMKEYTINRAIYFCKNRGRWKGLGPEVRYKEFVWTGYNPKLTIDPGLPKYGIDKSVYKIFYKYGSNRFKGNKSFRSFIRDNIGE